MFNQINDIIEKNKEKFNRFYELIVEYNSKFNITAIREKDDIYNKHFADSLYGLNLVSDNSKIIEIGSGGGFPSIPLKIANDSLNFTLIESVGKKCDFLNIVINELNLKNIKVVNSRAEDYIKQNSIRENFDYVIARAVAKLNTLSEYCVPFIKVGGKFLAYKSDESEINESENAFQKLGVKVKAIHKYKISDNFDERSIIEIQKIKKTPSVYPRGQGKERKNPL